jgi:protease-4
MFTDEQKQLIQKWMQETYVRFTQRVLTNRADKIKDIDKVARGRIFAARQAKDVGLVDELGGTSDALLYAAKQAHLETGTYDIRVVPQPKTLTDMLHGRDDEDAASAVRPDVSIAANSVLRMMPAPMRELLLREATMARLLDRHPVALFSPFIVTTK